MLVCCVMASLDLLQGLLYTGKGSMTLSPLHTERTLLSPPAMAGLFTTLLGLLDAKNGKLAGFGTCGGCGSGVCRMLTLHSLQCC